MEAMSIPLPTTWRTGLRRRVERRRTRRRERATRAYETRRQFVAGSEHTHMLPPRAF